MDWFWYFIIYSFLGFCLEVIFAWVTHNPKRDRKCFYLLPLCPVYGLGALAILALPAGVMQRPWLLLVCAALAATAAEYLMSLFYEWFTKVSFWDYRHLPLHINGRVCLLFSLFWGLLGTVLVHGVHPRVAALAEAIPARAALPGAMLLLGDAGVTVYLLRRTGTTGCLRWYQALARRPLGEKRQG
ncbi:hypothetical protein D1159_15650 [Pseudoflavonifractor sp. 524-17]|uniref:putative ABC transporter permease n=1 Tax=Pseudoflavonifractor sp. 524-17 TaxID=2304577 RepID=UPI0013797474|nr:putative ABC transporter permease [Pseudoflavonifractor sp. 524-17]NCE65975.1 hypothetical protein [Pseudoflavonifractor sp. 524-17]